MSPRTYYFAYLGGACISLCGATFWWLAGDSSLMWHNWFWFGVACLLAWMARRAIETP